MGSCSKERSFFGDSDVFRPTFLPLSLKRNGYYPSLPKTPEQGTLYDAIVGERHHGVSDWDMLSSQKYESGQNHCDDTSSEVFSLPREQTLGLPITNPPISESKKRRKTSPDWGSRDDRKDGNCCCQWLRTYLYKLLIKTPTEPPLPVESTPKPKQLTILERESTFKQISPKQLRRFSRKQQSLTTHFVYSAFIEDTVVELREERHTDVVYSITIKKEDSFLRNGSSVKFFSDDDITRVKNTSRHLKGATLDFMVTRLAEVFVGDSDDVNFLNVFLTTFRTFASPEELFKKLKDEYMELKSESNAMNIAVLKSIVRVFRAWLERYLLDDFQDGGHNKLLRELHNLAQVHDDVMNENDGFLIKKAPSKNNSRDMTPSPLMKRRNGVVSAGSFADYVAAKFAVLAKSVKDAEAESPQHSPSHCQIPSLDVTSAEGTMLNVAASKSLLNSLSSRHVATQLTVIAAKLFHCVKPHHCLATVASKSRPQSVRATKDQFNRVVYCVKGTILCPALKSSQRTKLLTKWIEVAQECRELKNFSTLHAIVSGLQTHSLHRLKKTWTDVPASHINLLKELADMNMKDLLMKVGTAKVNTEDSAIHRVRKEANMRRVQDMHSGIMHGTVPYLGSFLTDLTYLDTARPDFLEGGLINFQKRRKEFELLAQLQLWQASCRSYQNLEPDDDFLRWFRSVVALTDDQSLKLSEMIEPPLSSVTSPSHVTSPMRKSIVDMIHSEAEKNMSASPLWQKSSKKAENGSCAEPKSSQSFSGRINTSFAPSPSDKNRTVKIRLVRCKGKASDCDVADAKIKETSNEKAIAACEYRTITISSDERRAAVVKRALGSFKLDVEENLKRFSLVQLLQDKEIQIPDSANVFYAMSWSEHEPSLVLLEEGAEILTKVKRHQSTPVRPKKTRHRKNNSVTMDPDAGRASPLSMKNLYKQLAMGSMALVSGSYSPSDASRRSLDAREGATKGSVVLVNSKSGANVKNGCEALEKGSGRRSGAHRSSPLIGFRRTSRCHSADFAGSVVLPVRVVRTSAALMSTTQEPRFPKSAPTSPQFDRRGLQTDEEEFHIRRSSDVIHATGRPTKWSRYSESATAHSLDVLRSKTWSSRRTVRKPKKSRPLSTFYVSNYPLPSPAEENATPSNLHSEIETVLPENCSSFRPASFSNRSSPSRTLPLRLGPDFSGHDYTDEDSASQGTSSSASMTSDRWREVASDLESGSGIIFYAKTDDESVFHSAELDTASENLATDMRSFNHSDSLEAPSQGPIIKIQSASPSKELTELEIFGRYLETTSQSKGLQNDMDHDTVL